MFDRISDSLNGAFRKLSGRGTISEANIREAMDEVRTSLLEADVHYDVVKKFTADVVEDALGRDVTKSLKPGQEMIGIVHRRLVELLGGTPVEREDGALPGVEVPATPTDPDGGIMRVSPGPTIVMMSGLQGSGKTTTCGKLAGLLKKKGRSVMLAAADLQRPAAIEQLETVAKQADTELPGDARVHFYGEPDKAAEYGKAVSVAIKVCQRAVKAAVEAGVDVLILDTAGRLHINDELMGELSGVHRAVGPHHVFLVVDAMTGQDAVNSAKAFHERLAIDGVILTKFDSDTRGGAALSVKEVTGAPIRYVGTGERLDAIEEFHPERMAGRILGMGDVVSLVEKAQEQVSEEEAQKLEAKMMRGELGMDDFLKQLRAIKRMGPLKQIMGMLPGVGQALKGLDFDEGQLRPVEAMIQSMTPDERAKPKVIGHSRRRRIAEGSGTDQQQVSGLVKQFDMVNKMTKQLGGMSGKMGGAAGLAQGMANPAAMQGMLAGKGSTKSGSRGVKKRKKRR